MVSMVIILFLIAVLVSLFAGRFAEIIEAKLRGNVSARTAGRPEGRSIRLSPSAIRQRADLLNNQSGQ